MSISIFCNKFQTLENQIFKTIPSLNKDYIFTGYGKMVLSPDDDTDNTSMLIAKIEGLENQVKDLQKRTYKWAITQKNARYRRNIEIQTIMLDKIKLKVKYR